MRPVELVFAQLGDQVLEQLPLELHGSRRPINGRGSTVKAQ